MELPMSTIFSRNFEDFSEYICNYQILSIFSRFSNEKWHKKSSKLWKLFYNSKISSIISFDHAYLHTFYGLKV